MLKKRSYSIYGVALFLIILMIVTGCKNPFQKTDVEKEPETQESAAQLNLALFRDYTEHEIKTDGTRSMYSSRIIASQADSIRLSLVEGSETTELAAIQLTEGTGTENQGDYAFYDLWSYDLPMEPGTDIVLQADSLDSGGATLGSGQSDPFTITSGNTTQVEITIFPVIGQYTDITVNDETGISGTSLLGEMSYFRFPVTSPDSINVVVEDTDGTSPGADIYLFGPNGQVTGNDYGVDYVWSSDDDGQQKAIIYGHTLVASGNYWLGVYGYSGDQSFDVKVMYDRRPANPSASTSSSTSITLSWGDVSGETSYNILRKAYDSTGDFSQYDTAVQNSTSYTDTNVTSGDMYYYIIEPVGVSFAATYNRSEEILGAAGLPDPPTGVTASTGSLNQIVINWTAPAGDPDSYIVERASTSTGGYSQIASGITSTEYTDSGLADGVTWWYRVMAVKNPNTSTPSSVVSGSTGVPTPTNVTATTTYSNQITVSWNDISSAESYQVLRATSPTGTYSTIANPSANSYTNTGIASGTTYFYRIKAVIGTISSGVSDYAEGSTTPPPTNLTATKGTYDNRINLNWTMALGAERYYIYRADTSDGTFNYLAQTTSTTYSNTGLPDSTDYWYRVIAFATAWNSPHPSTAAVQGYTRPGQPNLISVTRGQTSNGNVTLTWDGVSEPDGGTSYYYVYRDNDTSPGGEVYEGYSTDSTTATVNVPAGNLYHFKVRVYNSFRGGYGDYSNYVWGYSSHIAIVYSGANTLPTQIKSLLTTFDPSSTSGVYGTMPSWYVTLVPASLISTSTYSSNNMIYGDPVIIAPGLSSTYYNSVPWIQNISKHGHGVIAMGFSGAHMLDTMEINWSTIQNGTEQGPTEIGWGESATTYSGNSKMTQWTNGNSTWRSPLSSDYFIGGTSPTNNSSVQVSYTALTDRVMVYRGSDTNPTGGYLYGKNLTTDHYYPVVRQGRFLQFGFEQLMDRPYTGQPYFINLVSRMAGF